MSFAAVVVVFGAFFTAGVLIDSTTSTFNGDVVPGISPFIIGGQEVSDLTQIPHQVALKIYPTTENETACEGSLLSPRFILTAAVCFNNVLAPDFALVAFFGGANTTYPQIVRLAWKVSIHPKWNNQTLENNIAIVEVSPVPLSYTIRPIRLPSRSQEKNDFSFQSGTIIGRGLSSNEGLKDDVRNLRAVTTQVVLNLYCKTRYLFRTISDSNICTSFSGAEGICKNDEGGSLFITEEDGNNTLIGVASFKDVECQSSLPSVFTRVTSYLEWINGVTSIPLRP